MHPCGQIMKYRSRNINGTVTKFLNFLKDLGKESEVKWLSPVQLFVTPWTVAYQAPPSMGFSRQEYWSGSPVPSPGDLPDPGIKALCIPGRHFNL